MQTWNLIQQILRGHYISSMLIRIEAGKTVISHHIGSLLYEAERVCKLFRNEVELLNPKSTVTIQYFIHERVAELEEKLNIKEDKDMKNILKERQL